MPSSGKMRKKRSLAFSKKRKKEKKIRRAYRSQKNLYKLCKRKIADIVRGPVTNKSVRKGSLVPRRGSKVFFFINVKIRPSFIKIKEVVQKKSVEKLANRTFLLPDL